VPATSVVHAASVHIRAKVRRARHIRQFEGPTLVEKRQYVSSVVIDIYRICLAEPAAPGCADGALRELLTQRLGAAP